MKSLFFALGVAGCAAAEPPAELPTPPIPPPIERPIARPAPPAVSPETAHATERVLVDTDAVRARAVCYVLAPATPPAVIERVTRLTLLSAAATARLKQHRTPGNVIAARAAAEALVAELPESGPACPASLRGAAP